MGGSSKEFPSGRESYRDWQGLTIGKFRILQGVAATPHPDNRHVPDKIRQQLQILRDLGLVEFLGQGRSNRFRHLFARRFDRQLEI
jgi:hypothetical protein